MKKSLYIGAMAALLLGTASCSNDMEPVVADGSEVAANFTLNLGDAVDSRAISDGEKADQLTFYVYENGKEIEALRQNVQVTNKHATVTTKLVKGHTYKFVFWAQNSNCAAYTISNTDDGNFLAVSYGGACNDENRDAFYTVFGDYTVTAPFTEDVVLTRPFAQLNILATDAASVTDFNNYTSALSCTDLSNTMTVLDGKVGTTTSTYGFTAAALPSESLPGYGQYKLVATGYFLASTEKTMTSVDFALTYDGHTDTKTIANVPLQRNYRTNIIGDFFTEGANYNIEINPMYETPDYVNSFSVKNAEEFMNALNFINNSPVGGVINIDGNVDLSNEANKIYISSKLHLILNERITTQKPNQVCIVSGGDVTVEGEGTIQATKGCFQVLDGGKLTIESGNYITTRDDSGSGIYLNGNANLTMNGGTIDCMFFGILNEGNGNITINGGEIKSQSHKDRPSGQYAYAVAIRGGGTVTINDVWVDGVHGALAVSNGTTTINGGYFTTHAPKDGSAQNVNFHALYVGDGHGSVIVNNGYFYAEPSTCGGKSIYLGSGSLDIIRGYFGDLGNKLGNPYNDYIMNLFGATSLDTPITDSEHNATYSYSL